jgi:hypothetical protein
MMDVWPAGAACAGAAGCAMVTASSTIIKKPIMYLFVSFFMVHLLVRNDDSHASNER